MADNPLVGFLDAVRIEVQLGWWVFVLAGLEVVHQAHFLISEHSARYNQFWIHKVWGRSERLQERKLSAWTRYRIGRIIRWVILIAVIAIFAGKIMHDAPLTALVLVPAILWHALPTVIQYAFLLFFTVAQFALLFWFLSRGGVDVYYPDDIKTRFSDVWGQDHVLERVKENIIFLENPELDRGPRRLRARRHPAVGPARHRQDADGRGGRRRDRQAVRVRRPGRVHQHVHGRRHPEGQEPVPQAAQAGAALRRRDRLLRRGRLARQPRHGHGRRSPAAAGRRRGAVRRRPAATASPTCRPTASGGSPATC